MNKIIYVIIAVVALGALMYYFGLQTKQDNVPQDMPSEVVTEENESESLMEPPSSYLCANDEVLRTEFLENGNLVILSLPDARVIALEQQEGEAASGVRYASEDGMFVFHTKGREGFVEENGVMLVNGCVAEV